MVLVATAISQLRDFLNTNVQGFEFLPDDALRHNPTQVLYQKPQRAVLRELIDVETRILLPIEGPPCADRGLEPDGGGWDNHQILAFIWALRPPEQVACNQARKAWE